ncbi:MAG: hypothetical protein JNL08_19130 [Planctomycetes bacterium]|nr:hypothetical protein [Planctomycetota bacterium]
MPVPCRRVLPGLCAATVAALLAAEPAAQAATTRARLARAQLAEFLDAARARTLAACRDRQIELPADFLAWIDAEPVRRTTVWGCRAEPLRVLLLLRALELDLGEATVRRDYPQLALAFAVQRSYQLPDHPASPWNDGDNEGATDALPDVAPRPPLVLAIPGDPRLPVDTKDPTRPLDRDDHIVNFLEDHAPIEFEVAADAVPPLEYDDQGHARPRTVAGQAATKRTRKLCAADVIASAALQAEFHAYMAAHGHADVRIDCGDRLVHWYSTAAIDDAARRTAIATAHELFHTAYRNKGRMPAARDRAPVPAESMAWLIRNDRHPFTAAQRAERAWPLFPLQAPWPLLMMLAGDDQPLREREDIWQRFRDRGERQTYGEYIGDIAQQFDMQSARRLAPFPFAYGSIQMMWKDGGVCGTMGNIGARTWRILGVPASTAGQPGHCALVRMEHDRATGRYRCTGEQYATGGDEVTTVHAGWNFDDRGGRRPMAFWLAVVWGCNRDFAAVVDALAHCRRFAALPPAQRAADAADFAADVLAHDPFALAAVEAALAATADTASAVALFDVFDRTAGPRLDAGEHALYRTTVRDLVHARALALPEPSGRSANESLLAELERQGCTDAGLLARTWRAIDGEGGFTARCRAEVQRWLESPSRNRSRRDGRAFGERVKAWSRTVKGKAARAAWANELLADFAGKEVLEHKGKQWLDPAVEVLCGLAGREPPPLPTR